MDAAVRPETNNNLLNDRMNFNITLNIEIHRYNEQYAHKKKNLAAAYHVIIVTYYRDTLTSSHQHIVL